MNSSPRLAFWRLVVLAVIISVQPALAIDWLVLVVDRSNSISREQLNLQRLAYARVLRDESILQILRGAGVAIVEFDSESEVVVSWTTAEDAAQRYEGWTSTGLRGGTAIGAGLSTAMRLLEGKDGARVIDVSGDGRDNRDPVLLGEALAQATASGVQVNGLVLRENKRNDVEAYYRERVVNGFVIMIERWEDFERSLKRKIGLEARLSGNWPSTERPQPSAANWLTESRALAHNAALHEAGGVDRASGERHSSLKLEQWEAERKWNRWVFQPE